MTDIQKASIVKRLSARLLDIILLACISVGFIFLIGVIINYDSHIENLDAKYKYYEETYDVKFNVTVEELNNMTEEERAHYDEVEKLIQEDKEFIKEYNLVINLTLIMVTAGIFLGLFVTEFIVPLFLKNGMTVGKKVFSLCLVRNNCVKISTIQLFIRTVLGKFALELMIPIYIIIMFYFGTIGILGTIILIGILLTQIILFFATRNRTVLHDLLSFTVVVDYGSQYIFNSEDELLEEIKQENLESVKNSKNIYN